MKKENTKEITVKRPRPITREESEELDVIGQGFIDALKNTPREDHF